MTVLIFFLYCDVHASAWQHRVTCQNRCVAVDLLLLQPAYSTMRMNGNNMVYSAIAASVGRCVDLFHWTLMMVLPSAYHEQLNMLLDKGVHKLAKVLDKEEVLED